MSEPSKTTVLRPGRLMCAATHKDCGPASYEQALKSYMNSHTGGVFTDTYFGGPCKYYVKGYVIESKCLK